MKFVLGFLALDFIVGIVLGAPILYKTISSYQETVAADRIQSEIIQAKLNRTVFDLCMQFKNRGTIIVLTHPLTDSNKNICK